MATRAPAPEDLERITELAKRWGKMVVKEHWGEPGPGLDVNLDQMEQVALAAVRGLLAGTLETATQKQAQRLAEKHPCPDCERLCPVVTEDRTVTTGESSFEHREPKAHGPDCRRDFFPQRVPLGLNSHAYSPRATRKIVEAGGELKSFAVAARVLKNLAGIAISAQHIRRLTEQVGGELAVRRDRGVEDYVHHRRVGSRAPIPSGVVVAVDGGRIQIRVPSPGEGPGGHEHGWKEDKVACLYTLGGSELDTDPHPDPPRVFTDRARVDELAREIHAQRGTNPDWPALPASAGQPARPETSPEVDEPPRVWPPTRGERSCVASTQGSDQFGKVVAAEAHARNFYGSGRRAFLGDGQRYNWAIRDAWFADFEPIADFVHVLSYLYAAATALSADADERWRSYVGWMTMCWQGRAGEVVTAIRSRAEGQGWSPPGAEVPEGDWRVVVERTLTYVSNNAGHMEYPRYRRLGLPVTSAAVESLIKEVNYRVKGTEKFWNHPDGAEAILQVRAAMLCDDDRLGQFLAARPGSPYRYTRRAAA